MHDHHAVAWLDHQHAKVFFFDREGAESLKLSTSLPHHQTHNKAGTRDGKRQKTPPAYYKDIVAALRPAREWLIVGPGSAKDELVRHVKEHHADLAARIIGVETADHPTDGQLLAHARTFFRAADRMLP